MTYIVTEPCLGCRHTVCVEVCPVDCFHFDDKMLYIDPIECIDCNACVPECPEEAIYPENDVPEQWAHYTQINADKSAELPVISAGEEPLKERSDCND